MLERARTYFRERGRERHPVSGFLRCLQKTGGGKLAQRGGQEGRRANAGEGGGYLARTDGIRTPKAGMEAGGAYYVRHEKEIDGSKNRRCPVH